MNKLFWIVGIAALCVAGMAATFGLLSYRNKKAYEALMEEWSQSFLLRPVDRRSESFLSERHGSWLSNAEPLVVELSTMLRSVGLTPSLQDLSNVLCGPAPEFCWWPQSRNTKALALASVKCSLLEISAERTLHVSTDGQVVLLWISTDTVLMFEDRPGGILGTRYVLKEGTAPGSAQ
jgi:hypothetical protein